jgi:hypothetical protein
LSNNHHRLTQRRGERKGAQRGELFDYFSAKLCELCASALISRSRCVGSLPHPRFAYTFVGA